ncbi:MAG: acetylornithine deacetylase [Acidobacteria bacterium]|nr:acetylornithine deacetylase [Acidobacteriota bacterium]
MSVEKTLATLVGIDSVSQRSNAQLVDYLTQRCEKLGLGVRRLPYTDEFGIEKINLIALAGAEFSDATAVELSLVGHTDTVPYDPQWTDALNLTEKDGKLYGRGSCDTKAFIAAALTAVENLDLKSLSHPLALVFTADEELGLFGAKRLAAAKALRTRYAIVGEPTSLQPMRAGKGYCLAEVTVRGKEAHSAYPAVGASAILRAARLLTHIENISQQIQTEQHADFDPPYTTLNVGLIRGGTAKNVIPGECRFTLEWRPVPGQERTRVLELITFAIQSEQQRDQDFEYEIDAGRTDEGFETPAHSQLVNLLEEITGRAAGTVAFGTEAPQMIELGAEAVVLGPGDIRVAHRTAEFVPIDELHRCVEILGKAISHYCL